MSDDLERRLEQLGAAPTTPMSVTAVDALEATLLATRRSVVPWRPLLATAAAVLLLAGAVFAMQRTDNDSLRPATTAATTTIASSTMAGSSTTAVSTSTTTTIAATTTVTDPVPTTPGDVPPTNPGTSTATVPGTSPGTVPATVPPTAPPTSPPAPTTTQAPVVIPPASFTLTVQRVGDRLVFNWPAYTGGDGRQYVLVRVGPAGLNTWPVGPARIAEIVARMNVTTTFVDQPNTEQRRWVLAVVGENRTLLAVSSVAISA